MKVDIQEQTADQCEVMVGLLAGLDATATLDHIGGLRSSRSAVEVIGDVILPALRVLQGRYRTGELDGAALAAITALARRGLSRAGYPAAAAPPGAPRRVVVVAAPAAAAGLDADGAYESLLAAGRPAQLVSNVADPDSLSHHLRSVVPVALVVAAEEARSLPSVAAIARSAGQAGVPVLAVGPAFGPAGARSARIGATAWAPDPAGMLDTLDQWHRRGGALPMNVEEPPDAVMVRTAWPAVVMAAAGTGGPDEAWAQATVRALGEVVVASLWAADVAVLLDWLDDELAGPDRTHVRDVHVVGLLDAVYSALPASMAAASSMIGEARDHLRQRILRPGRPGRPALRPVPPADPAPAPGPARAAETPSGSTPTQATAGQAFADLLLLGALSAQATGAALAVFQPGGKWSALAHGLEQREGLNDPALWSTIAARHDPVEIADMGAHHDLSRSPLAQRPLSLRWAYGTALRDQDGSVIGVFCLLDRWLRQVTRREQRTLSASARQLTALLLEVRRPAAPAPGTSIAPATAWAAAQPAERPTGGSRRSVGLPEGQQLLRSHEVAVLFDVTERTVINWAAAGKLPSLRTIGGHLRFRSDDVYALLSSRQGGC